MRLKAMSRVLGFPADWFRGNLCVILQYSVAFSIYQPLSHQALRTAAISQSCGMSIIEAGLYDQRFHWSNWVIESGLYLAELMNLEIGFKCW